MNLVISGQSPNRVLIGKDADGNHWNAQENSSDPASAARFAGAIDNSDHIITRYEDTQEYADGQEAMRQSEIKMQITALEQNSSRALRELVLDPSNNASRGILQQIEDDIVALRAQL